MLGTGVASTPAEFDGSGKTVNPKREQWNIDYVTRERGVRCKMKRFLKIADICCGLAGMRYTAV